jgi:hypothetical protein
MVGIPDDVYNNIVDDLNKRTPRMPSKTAQITLGEFTFTAHKFNLGETEEVTDLQETMASTSTRERLVAMRRLVLIAAQRDKPALTDADLREIEATPRELSEAVFDIMALNGYARARAVGEVQAGDQAA